MTPEELEQAARQTAQDFSFVRRVEILLRTPATLTMRFHITERSFVQIYSNSRKALLSLALVVDGTRVFGRDCEEGVWHCHPFEAPETHDFTSDEQKAVTVRGFLAEVEGMLKRLQII